MTSQRKSPLAAIRRLARPDEWALDLELKVDGRPFSLEGREYIVPVIRDTSDEIVIKKAAQMSFTTLFLVRTLHWITERGWHHLYLLPNKTGAIPFVQSRIDPIIDSNSVIQEQFASVDNRLHKQTKEGIKLLVRGTNISTELQETPVDVEIWDERDRMVEENLEDARTRMDGSHVKKLAQLSTPTVPGHGVDSEDTWHASDQHLWEIPCIGCGRWQFLNFRENLRIGTNEFDCALICVHCQREFKDHERALLNAKGRWVPQNLNGHLRGYHINQFSSPTKKLSEMMRTWFVGQREAKKLRSFFNNTLGEPYVAAGDQFTAELLDKCVRPSHRLGGLPLGPVYVGIDIGAKIHVRADYLNRWGQRMAWQFKIFNEWNEVDNFLSRLTNFLAVCDAHPEKRNARDLSLKYPGRFWLGFEMDRPQTNEIASWQILKTKEAGKVVIDRTMALDQVIYDYMHGNVILPPDARELGEILPRLPYNDFYHHMMQMVRVEEEDSQGRIVARWKKNKNPDHWHHADMFCFIATLKAPALQVPVHLGNAMREAGSLIGG